MFGEALAAILGLIKKGNTLQAKENIDNAYVDFLQKEASFFTEIPKEKLTHTLLHGHNYTNQHLEILAYLFYAEAEINYKSGKFDECRPYAEKSLLLFEFIDIATKTFSEERNIIISTLQSYLKQLE
jgi:hypothetical protein